MSRLVRWPLAGLLFAAVALAQAAEDAPPAGSWKVTLPLNPSTTEKPLWLVKLENQDGKWGGRVLASARGFPEASLENLAVTKDSLRFRIKMPKQTFSFEFRLPDEKATKLYGVLKRGRLDPAELEQTSLTSLDPFDLLKETLATRKDNATAMESAMSLLSMASAKKAKPEEVRSWAARAAKAAEAYGPRLQRDVLLTIVGLLHEQTGYETIAVTYARQAERLLEDNDRPGTRRRVLDALAQALTKAGKADEAKEVEARARKIDPAIKPTPFAGRKGEGDRAVLVELFTAAEAPPCVAADLAFDALGKTFKPSEVIRLQYHPVIRTPDLLTNPDSEARLDYYHIEAAPSVLFNGRPGPAGGGGADGAWDKYEEYVEGLTPLLEDKAAIKLKAAATRKGDKINIDVTASEARSEGDLRLRVALVEEQVAYDAKNKKVEHQQVVRAFAGGADGEKVKGESFKKSFTLDVEEVRKKLRAYLEKVDKEKGLPGKERPLDLKKLRIVAFVQNDATHEVLQAVQADVSE